MKEWHKVAQPGEIAPGQPKIVSLQGKEIGVFFEGGRYFAVLNYCPHFGAPICRGMVSGAVVCDEDGKPSYDHSRPVLRCPWHRWEFDMETGRALAPIKERIKTYEVRVEGDEEPKDSVDTFAVRLDESGVWVEM